MTPGAGRPRRRSACRVDGTFDSVRISGLDDGVSHVRRHDRGRPARPRRLPVTLHRDAEPESDTPGTADTAVAADTGRPVALAPEFPVLDTLRVVGALGVVTTHTSFQSGDYIRPRDLGRAARPARRRRRDLLRALRLPAVPAARRRPPPPSGRGPRDRPLLLEAVPAHLPRLRRHRGARAGLHPGERTAPACADWVRDAAAAGHASSTDQLPQGLTQMWSLAVEVCVLPRAAAAGCCSPSVARVHRLRRAGSSRCWLVDGRGQRGLAPRWSGPRSPTHVDRARR